MNTLSARVAQAVLVLIAAVGLTIIITDDSGPGPTHHRTITIKVDGPDRDTKRDDPLVLTPPAQKVAKAPGEDLLESQRGPDPTPASVIHGPLASQEWPGCRVAFVKSFSQRTSPIKAIALHFTAGPNIAGSRADLNGLTAFSNNIRNQVSWHFGIDRDGNCDYNVPITQKAWTISGLNSATVNIEVVGTGHDVDYAGAGFKKVSAVVRRIASIEHIPLRLGATDGQCHVTRSGIITHWMGGPCSGGHVDIKPYEIKTVIARIARDAQPSGLAAAKRSHRIVHAKITKRCRGAARHSSACTALFKRNGELHAKYHL
jgi:hypothetical protein